MTAIMEAATPRQTAVPGLAELLEKLRQKQAVLEAVLGSHEPNSLASARLLTETELARLLNLHVQTVRKWRRVGNGPPHIALGPNRRGYRLRDVESWLESRATTAT